MGGDELLHFAAAFDGPGRYWPGDLWSPRTIHLLRLPVMPRLPGEVKQVTLGIASCVVLNESFSFCDLPAGRPFRDQDFSGFLTHVNSLPGRLSSSRRVLLVVGGPEEHNQMALRIGCSDVIDDHRPIRRSPTCG